jgi:hypothetical protein
MVPPTAVIRSWLIVPMTGPSEAIFIEESRLGTTVNTCARVIGYAVGPRFRNGWPNP